MEKWVGHVAFVTGASAGIGKAVAEELVEQGLKVIGFARRKELLDELEKKLSSKKGKFYAYAGDASKEEDILKACQWTKDNVGSISVLINNAAILGLAKLSECETKIWQQQLDVNVLAPCITAKEAIKQMKENKIDGHIININSTAGHKIIPNQKLNLYNSTKYALTALTETLRLQLALEGSKIRVTSISPGGVRTDMMNTALAEFGIPADSTLSINLLEPTDIANAVLYVLSTPATVNITELTIQATGEKM
ncbi:farnesol dehydrogenase-like [Diorhabda sublineata]|uniref:farnesol dehydrogenase-like n=1 Tax=Diorhabda sublineata TaxID=1163346 RepID=UPI0024E17E8F|nr:farnesol dehydrogenase-like [Diorhabda sublineata]